MTMRRRLTRLEQALPPPDPEEELRHQRWLKVVDRFFGQLEQAAALLSPDEEPAVEKALADLGEGDRWRGPYADWLRDLQDGWSRLPELPPTVMKELLVAWSSPGVRAGAVCQHCGLEFPTQQNYRPLLAACPGCGSREWDWAHLVRDHERAWKALDGYAGGRQGSIDRPHSRSGRRAAEREGER